MYVKHICIKCLLPSKRKDGIVTRLLEIAKSRIRFDQLNKFTLPTCFFVRYALVLLLYYLLGISVKKMLGFHKNVMTYNWIAVIKTLV